MKLDISRSGWVTLGPLKDSFSGSFTTLAKEQT